MIANRRRNTVELNNVLRARGRGRGGRTFLEHRKQVHHAPGSLRVRGALLQRLAGSNDAGDAKEPVTQLGRALVDLHDPKAYLNLLRTIITSVLSTGSQGQRVGRRGDGDERTGDGSSGKWRRGW